MTSVVTQCSVWLVRWVSGCLWWLDCQLGPSSWGRPQQHWTKLPVFVSFSVNYHVWHHHSDLDSSALLLPPSFRVCIVFDLPSDDVTHHHKILALLLLFCFCFFTTTASLHFSIEYGWGKAWQFAHDVPFFNDIIAKCDRSVRLKRPLCVSRKVFALLPFACGCPVLVKSYKMYRGDTPSVAF